MRSFFRWSSGKVALLVGITASAVTPILISTQVLAQATAPTPAPASPTPGAAATFSDVAPDYWARPFIQALYQLNVKLHIIEVETTGLRHL